MNEKEFIQKYPESTHQDYIKYIYQSFMGPSHLDQQQILTYLTQEQPNPQEDIEPISNTYVRFHFSKDTNLQLLSKLVQLSSKQEDIKRLENVLTAQEIEQIQKEGIHHSKRYTDAYHPHYRLIHKDYANYYPLIKQIDALLQTKKNITISIDGNSNSGKTSLASLLEDIFPSNLIHMDDFFLPKEQRKEDWFETIGGNMNFPLINQAIQTKRYQPFLCSTQSFQEEVVLEDKPLLIVEGSYSQHPLISLPYNLKVCLTCTRETQIKRLKQREKNIEPFLTIWLVKEDKYLSQYAIQEHCDQLIKTDQFF